MLPTLASIPQRLLEIEIARRVGYIDAPEFLSILILEMKYEISRRMGIPEYLSSQRKHV